MYKLHEGTIERMVGFVCFQKKKKSDFQFMFAIQKRHSIKKKEITNGTAYSPFNRSVPVCMCKSLFGRYDQTQP